MLRFSLFVCLLVCALNASILWDHFLYFNGGIYDLSSENDLVAFDGEYILTFRLSGHLTKKCKESDDDSFAILTKQGNSDFCESLTTDDDIETEDIYGYKDPQRGIYMLAISFPMGDDKLKFRVITRCSDQIYEPVLTENGDTFNVLVQGPKLCPNSIGIQTFWMYFAKYKAIFAIVFWTIGILLLWFGANVFSVMMFIIGFISTLMFFNVVFNNYCLPYDAPIWELWAVFIFSVVLGTFVGYLSIKLVTVGMVLLGGLFGAIVGLILFSTIVYRICDGQSWVLLLTVIICSAGSGILGWHLKSEGVIIFSSLIGSYMIVRAVSWFVGGYPNEWTLFQQIKTMSISYWGIWIYMGCILLLTAAGIIIQCMGTTKDDLDSKIAMLKETKYE